MPSLGPAEILVILVVALIVLGPNKLPEAGRQLGKALAEMRRWTNGLQSELHGMLDVDDQSPPSFSNPETSTSPTQAAGDGQTDRDAGGGDEGTEHAEVPHLRPPSQFPDQQSFN